MKHHILELADVMDELIVCLVRSNGSLITTAQTMNQLGELSERIYELRVAVQDDEE